MENGNTNVNIGLIPSMITFWLLLMITSQIWYGTTTVLIEPETYILWSFWFFVLLTILVIIVIILFILALFSLFYKLYIRWSNRNERKEEDLDKKRAELIKEYR